jgi:hypothetical protein
MSQMVTSITKPEKRIAIRQDFDHKCWIVRPEPDQPILAHIANISVSGALLTVYSPHDVPDEFTLYLTEDGRVHRRCRVAWRGVETERLEFPSL